MTNINEANFKDYLFATYDTPSNLVGGFVMNEGTYTGRFIVKIYVPGENEFISFTIRSAVELSGLDSNSKTCHYQLLGAFKNPSLVSNYFSSDKKLFSGIINDSNVITDSSLLCKSRISETTLSGFIDTVKDFFNNITQTIFCDKFKLKDINNQPITPILNPNFNQSLIDGVNQSFESIKRFLDKDYSFSSSLLTEKEIKSFRAITQEVNLVRLRQELADSLDTKEPLSNRVKI